MLIGFYLPQHQSNRPRGALGISNKAICRQGAFVEDKIIIREATRCLYG